FYISSDYGKDAIVGKKGGAVVDHIYEEDLLRLNIPVVSDKIINQLFQKYLEVKTLREEPQNLLQTANDLIHDYNQLPTLDKSEAEYYDKSREIATRLVSTSEISSDYRLDGHFYNPFFQLAEKSINDYSANTEVLAHLCSTIFMGNRFTRNYVDAAF